MDPNVLKTALPLVGGFLALLGGVFTFVNGRLRDAEDSEQRAAVLHTSAQWVAIAPSLLGIVATFVGARPYVAVALFSLSYILQARLFLQNPNPLRRVEVLTFGLLTSTLIASLLFLAFGNVIERIVENQAGMLEIQRKTIEAIKGSKSVP